MRCTQMIGLKADALDWLRSNCNWIVDRVCPHCGGVLSHKLQSTVYEDASSLGMFDDGPELSAYRLKNGQCVKEVVQCVPWSSGPMIFLCLEKEDGTRMFEWSDEEIEKS